MAKLHPSLLNFVEETYGEEGLKVVSEHEFSETDPLKQLSELKRLLSKEARKKIVEEKVKKLEAEWRINQKVLKAIDEVGGKVTITLQKDDEGNIVGFTLTAAKGGTGGGGERKSYKVITPEGKELNFSSAKQMREGLHKAIGYRTPQVKTEDFIKKLAKEGYKVTEL